MLVWHLWQVNQFFITLELAMTKTLLNRQEQIKAIEEDWANNPRWKGVKRGYSAADVVRLRGSMHI